MTLLVAAGLLAACGGGGERAERRPNVVLVFLDALRADHLGCYGYARETSPALDSLAAGGVRVSPIVVPCPATFPSVPGTLTSRRASWFYDAGKCVLKPEYLTLAEVLQGAGYRTAGISSSPIVTSRQTAYSFGGFEQGFDEFDDSWAQGKEMNWQWRSPEGVVGAALSWLARGPDTPFFLFLYIEDPHDAYRCPEPFASLFDPGYSGPPQVMAGDPGPYEQAALDGRPHGLEPRDLAHLAALYDGEIRYADTQLGRLFDRLRDLGLFHDTLIVVTSDHGEELGDHGGFKHAYALYEQSIRAPLLLSWPSRLPAGTVVTERLVESIDIVPTVLELAGVPQPPGLEGMSVVPLIDGDAVQWRRFALCETPYADAKAIVSGEWKLIQRFETYVERPNLAARYARGAELYNLAADPGERHDLIAERPEIADELRAVMMAMLPVKERERVIARRPLRLDPEVVERLRSLGYLR